MDHPTSHSELDPEPSLRRDVRCFWTLEEEADLYNRDAILPDSSVEIVIACGAPLVMIDREGGSVPLPRAFVIGLQSRPLRLRATGLCQVVGMRVDPWSVGTFIDSPPLRDGVAPATGRWEKIAEHIAGRVRRRGYEEALAALGMVAEEERRRVARRVPPTIVEAGEMLREAGGAIGIENVAARCGISLSTLERGFREAAGLSPKAFARLVRGRAGARGELWE